jgi:drug/metabolite transporter (DMT)-like permease
MHWFLLALVCAFCLASADACTKKYLSAYSAPELVVVRFSLSGLFLAPLLFIYPLPPLPLAFWGWIAAAIPLEIVAMLLYMRAIRDNALSTTLPYLAFTPVIAALGAWVLLGERVSAWGLIGILLVVFGAYCIHLRRGQGMLRPSSRSAKTAEHGSCCPWH